MTNALAGESSPYLRQHAENPVDWLPWGETAFARARELDRPLLVSIGYAACHWCHVMEHECFSKTPIAEVMNRLFVCVKVDREERPDVDSLYMEAVQAMAGQGGWPLNVFLTPDALPFYGGTYFPPEPRPGMPSWTQVLEAVSEAWGGRREEIAAAGERLRERLGATARLAASTNPLQPAALDAAVDSLEQSFDRARGGWGGAPKFPPSATLGFLLRRAASRPGGRELSMARATLDAMASGGIHDQVGGGFHRYAVDGAWAVPHFEKMLYDNALLARVYLQAHVLTGEDRLLDVARGTLDWVLRDLRGPEGAFYSSLDADSEGEEGRFYVWRLDELREILGERAPAAIEYFGASEEGNFEGATNVLQAHGSPPPGLAEIRRALREARERRPPPALDDKRIASWNALMISALAEAGAHLPDGEPYLHAARTAADFLLSEMRDGNGRLLRVWHSGRAHVAGLLEDHAFLLEALLALYESSFEERWLHAARELAASLLERFGDPVHGGFFSTPADARLLLTRRKELEDAPIPSGLSSAALGLLRLSALTGEQELREQGESALRLTHELAPRYPVAFGHLLSALDFALAPVREVAVVGPEPEPLLAVLRSTLRPHLVLAAGDGRTATGVPLLEGRPAPVRGALAYVCEHFSCQAPVDDAQALQILLDAGAQSTLRGRGA